MPYRVTLSLSFFESLATMRDRNLSHCIKAPFPFPLILDQCYLSTFYTYHITCIQQQRHDVIKH